MATGTEIKVRFKGRTYSNPRTGFAAVALRLRRDIADSAKDVRQSLHEYMDRVIQSLIERHSGQWPGGTSDSTLSRRTGTLIETIRQSGEIAGTSYDNLRGSFKLTGTLLIHEYGGTIQGGGKMLTIPLPAALDARGVPLKRSAREWKNTFVAETRAGNLIIFQRRGGRKIVPLYLLRDEVYIPPRLGFRKEAQKQVPYFMERAADDIVRRVASR